MAKKAAASKKAASAKRAGRVQVPMHSVVHFVRMLHDEGHADKFAAAAKKSKAVLSLHPDSVNFVQNFLSKNKLHPAMRAMRANDVIDPCPGDPFRCNFRDNS